MALVRLVDGQHCDADSLGVKLGRLRVAWEQTPGPASAVTKLVISPVWQFGAPLAAMCLLAWLWRVRPRKLTYVVVFATITLAFWLTYIGRTGDVIRG
jgi:hypothetical protein